MSVSLPLVTNSKAHHEYTISETLSAGMVLTGAEAKSLRLKHGSLTGSFVKVVGREVYLLNAQINPYAYADNSEYDPKRSRKLLLTHKEIIKLLTQQEQKGMVAVPLSVEAMGRFIKLKIGIGRGKKQYERRAELKRKDQERDIRREVKEHIRLK
jgi:SsrA-binding protein